MSSLGYHLDTAEERNDAAEAEETLLVALLSSTFRPQLPDLLEEVDAADFYDTNIGSMWSAASDMLRRGDKITRRALFAEAPGDGVRKLVEKFSGELVRYADLRNSVNTVIENARMRRFVQALKRVAQYAEAATYSEALHFANEQLNSLAEAKPSGDVKTFADVLERWNEWLDAPKEAVRVIPTPWFGLNEHLAGGLQPGRSYVIGGRPGEGKSIALLNLVSHAAERGHAGVIFSVEMGDIEVVSRIMSAGSGAKYAQIMRRDVDHDNRLKLAEYQDSHGHMPLTLIDRSDITVDYIAAQCRTLKRRPEGLDVVVVDYLQLLKETDSRQSRERQVAQISRALKLLARECDVAVLVACQLNRNVTAGDRKPGLADLRESGAIEQDADVAILLHHERINNEPTGKVSLCIAKNRTGRLGVVDLNQMFDRARLG